MKKKSVEVSICRVFFPSVFRVIGVYCNCSVFCFPGFVVSFGFLMWYGFSDIYLDSALHGNEDLSGLNVTEEVDGGRGLFDSGLGGRCYC